MSPMTPKPRASRLALRRRFDMARFTGPLDVRQKITKVKRRFWFDKNVETWIILSPFRYYINGDDGEFVDIEAGYETDFASVPPIFWSLGVSKSGPHAQPAVVHDKLYQTRRFARGKCDRIFLEAMKL